MIAAEVVARGCEGGVAKMAEVAEATSALRQPPLSAAVTSADICQKWRISAQ
jgi:hypothetical protein